MWLRPADTVLANDPDNQLFIWTLAWNVHALTSDPLSIFDANIYHPQRLTLAYSENLIGSAPFAAPAIWLADNPVLAMNVVELLSVWLCGVGGYVLARRLGLTPAAAVICGLVFAFSPARFFRTSQLHLGPVQWIPFALAFLHTYFDHGRPRDLKLAMGFFTLQAATSGHGAVFAALAMALLIAWKLALGEPFALGRRLRDAGLAGVAFVALTVVLFVPYRIVQVEIGLRRHLENWGAARESFIASPTTMHAALLSWFAPHANETASAYLFPGYLALALAIAAVWRRRRGPSNPTVLPLRAAAVIATVSAALAICVTATVLWNGPIRIRTETFGLISARSAIRAAVFAGMLIAARWMLRRWVPFVPWRRFLRIREALRKNRLAETTAFYTLLTAVSVLLAAGPPVSLWPLVYWLPGFNFIRGPSRFMILGVLGLAVLAGLGLQRLAGSLAPRHRVAAVALTAVVMLAEFAAVPLDVVPLRLRIPAADRWLDGRPKPFVVAEAPVMTSERYHTAYMLHSMAHWQKTVHGYSGIRPALHDELFDRMRSFPDEASLASLARLGVTYVVVHEDMYLPGQWPDVEERLRAHASRLTLEYESGFGRVYRLR